MKPGPAAGPRHQPWPRWWRMVLVAICVLILCSCRSGDLRTGPSSCPPGPCPTLSGQALPGLPNGYAGTAWEFPVATAGDPAAGIPPAAVPGGPWAPPGFRQPWPQDEYLSDGGDAAPAARVGEDWEVRGLNVEDTIAHFDTVDGRTLVEPSNRVHIYSLRFRAVRQVVSLRQSEQWDPWAGVHQPLTPVGHDEVQIAAKSKQHYQAKGQLGRDLLTIYRSRQGDGAMSTVNGPLAFQDQLLPFEAPLAIGQGILEESEMAWLAEGVDAAIAWSSNEGLQVIIDRAKAAAEVGDQRVQTVFTIKEPPANPRLRVIKVASTPYAAPGETVDFTLRFDNVGNQVIGNVTLIDNLTTRLEYVPDTAQCSVPAEFVTQPNEGGSLVLRWEITDPLEPGQGGIIRFRCRVR